MKIAVFGGSFDPPHVGHVLAAHYLLCVGQADRVVVVPVFQHALEKNLAPYELRVEMCRESFSGDERITVSEVEAGLPSPSYTLRTLVALREVWGEHEYRLVVGADVLSETEKWHEFAEDQRLAPLLVLGRAGVDASEAPRAILPEVSSTEARKWWHAEASERDRALREQLIPFGARRIIERAGLYRNPSS
jgi:nicotinate-nucleotide adenylyltransferase